MPCEPLAGARCGQVAMNALFGKKKTTKEVVREQQREISKEKRHLDREIRELELQEKRIITKIKQLSAKGDMGSGERTRRRGHGKHARP
jgi:hypothetical protein